MIFPILYTFKGKMLLGFYLISTTIAVTEAFFDQLIIALIVALIGATPPTVAILISSRRQSKERKEGNKELLDKQQEVAEALDGKLTQLMTAEKGVSKAEGIAEERIKGEAAIEKAEQVLPHTLPGSSAETPLHTKTTNTPEDPVNVKPVEGKKL